MLFLGRDRRPPARILGRPLQPVVLIKSVKGSAKAVRADDRRDLAQGETVYLGEGIETGTGASLSMTTYPMDATVGLGADTTVLFETSAEVRVEGGQVRADIGP